MVEQVGEAARQTLSGGQRRPFRAPAVSRSTELVLRALDVAQAFSIGVVGERDGKPEYMASVRLPGLATWEVAFDHDPMKALVKAVDKAEIKTMI